MIEVIYSSFGELCRLPYKTLRSAAKAAIEAEEINWACPMKIVEDGKTIWELKTLADYEALRRLARASPAGVDTTLGRPLTPGPAGGAL